MASKKKVFISFDVDHDALTKEALAAQAKLEDSPFDFYDASIKSELSGDWKEKARIRIRNADIVIVLCGEHTGSASGVSAELELVREERKSYFCLRAYADKVCVLPKTAPSGEKLYRWTWDNLKNLIGGSR